MEELHTAAHSNSQRSFHDFSSATHDRGHAGPEPFRKYPTLLHPASLPVRATLQQTARTVGARADPNLFGSEWPAVTEPWKFYDLGHGMCEVLVLSPKGFHEGTDSRGQDNPIAVTSGHSIWPRRNCRLSKMG